MALALSPLGLSGWSWYLLRRAQRDQYGIGFLFYVPLMVPQIPFSGPVHSQPDMRDF